MLAKTKGEARHLLKMYEIESEKLGLIVKANSGYYPIGTELKNGKKKRKRKRGKGQKHQLPGL